MKKIRIKIRIKINHFLFFYLVLDVLEEDDDDLYVLLESDLYDEDLDIEAVLYDEDLENDLKTISTFFLSSNFNVLIIDKVISESS
jgi:hypothetical protein